VPYLWPEDPRLATWTYSQRQYKKKLENGERDGAGYKGMTAERVARLDELGMVWDGMLERKKGPADALWERNLSNLVAYKAEHGHCIVPRSHRAEDPPQCLGLWVAKQRAYKRKLDRGEPSDGLTAERVAKLDALGFIWGSEDAVWEGQLVRLAAYKAAHGDCKVPKGWPEDPQFSYWVGTQREQKR
jgi:hypothetical protein